jgi:hypothetical protein
LEGKKCLELVLLDDSNYESWCISILRNIETFNPYLLSIINSSICPPNITWANLSEEERKCLKLNVQAICLLTQSLSPNVEALILKEHGVPMNDHLLWKYIKENEYACSTNVSSCVDPLEKENANLKTQLEVLTSKHVKL